MPLSQYPPIIDGRIRILGPTFNNDVASISDLNLSRALGFTIRNTESRKEYISVRTVATSIIKNRHEFIPVVIANSKIRSFE